MKFCTAWLTGRMARAANMDGAGFYSLHGSQSFGAARVFPCRLSAHNGEVLLVNTSLLHGATKFVGSFGIFRDEHETACLTIQAIDKR